MSKFETAHEDFRFIQITASEDEHSSSLYALDNRGYVYQYLFESSEWVRLSEKVREEYKNVTGR